MDEKFKNIDDWMRKALEDHEEPFDDNAWDAMDAMLDAPPPPPQSVDDAVRHALNGYEPAFEEGAWVKMEAMLDAQPKSAPFLFFQNRVVKIAAALLLALLSAGVISHFLSSEKSPIVKDNTNTTVQEEAISSEKYQVKTSTNPTPTSVETEEESLEFQQNNMMPLFPKLNKDKQAASSTILPSSSPSTTTPVELDDSTFPDAKTQERTNDKASDETRSEELAAISTDKNAVGTETKNAISTETKNVIGTEMEIATTNPKETVKTIASNQNNASSVKQAVVMESAAPTAKEANKNLVKEEAATTTLQSSNTKQPDENVLASIPSKKAKLIQEELALTVPTAERVEANIAANLPDLSNHFLRHSIGTESFAEMNFVDKMGNANFGYSTGMAYEYRLNKRWGLKTGLYWSIKRFYSEDLETPPYLLGTLNNSTVEYASVEIPLVAKFYVQQSKRWESFVALGHSVFIPVKEKYYFTVAPPTETYLDSYENNFAPVTNTAYTSDSDNVRNRPPSYLGAVENPSSQDGFFDALENQPEDKDATNASILPLDARTRPMWGHINLGIGTKLKLNEVHALSFSALGKVSVDKQKFDLQVSDYRISNYKRYFSMGLSLGWVYSFGHRTVGVKGS